MQYFFEARCFRVGAYTFVVGASEDGESSGSSLGGVPRRRFRLSRIYSGFLYCLKFPSLCVSGLTRKGSVGLYMSVYSCAFRSQGC